MSKKAKKKPHIVIIGGGFGGLSAAKVLSKVDAEITLIDRHNYHLFQPLLYQIATATLSPSNIAWPIRHILKAYKNIQVLLDKVIGIDARHKKVKLKYGDEIAYDYLVVATGARHSYFGKNEWEAYAPGIKTIEDAITLRHKILSSFEHAEIQTDPEIKQKLLTFVVIGGGPTGVELAGAIAGLSKRNVADNFASIKKDDIKIMLIEGGSRLLPSFAPKLSDYAQKSLEKMGIEIKTSTFVEHVDGNGIIAGDLKVNSANVIWAAGVKASPVGTWLKAETDRTGRVIVSDDLTVKGYDNIYVIGDTASYTPKEAKRSLPGIAPVAKQMGAFVGKHIRDKIAGRKNKGKSVFVYKDYGTMATIGRNSAVADFKKLRFSGFFAWWLWGIAHIYFLLNLKNRIIVSLNWLWQYITSQPGVRLIATDSEMLFEKESKSEISIKKATKSKQKSSGKAKPKTKVSEKAKPKPKTKVSEKAKPKPKTKVSEKAKAKPKTKTSTKSKTKPTSKKK